MRREQEMVREFHEKYGFAIGKLWKEPMPMCKDFDVRLEATTALLDLGLARIQLIQEELHELTAAWRALDRVEIADALADLAYVILGTAVAAGIDLEPLVHEVHFSNMTKDPGMFKPEKGDGYKPPNIKGLLEKQGFKI